MTLLEQNDIKVIENCLKENPEGLGYNELFSRASSLAHMGKGTFHKRLQYMLERGLIADTRDRKKRIIRLAETAEQLEQLRTLYKLEIERVRKIFLHEAERIADRTDSKTAGVYFYAMLSELMTYVRLHLSLIFIKLASVPLSDKARSEVMSELVAPLINLYTDFLMKAGSKYKFSEEFLEGVKTADEEYSKLTEKLKEFLDIPDVGP